MEKKVFDLETKPKRKANEPLMVAHEEAKPLGFWGKMKLGTSWKDILLYVVLAAVAFGLAVLVTNLLAKKQEKKIEQQQAEVPKEVELPPVEPSAPPAQSEPKAAATPTVDKVSFKVRVLNGNGITGDAKKIAELLKDKGFQTGGVANASGIYQKTQVWYIAQKKAEGEAVAAALEGKETELKEAEQAVVGRGFEVLVIVGVK